MASASDIPALVRRLRSPRRLEQVQAAAALAEVAAQAPAEVLAAGGCKALARLLVSGSSQTAQTAAARALNVVRLSHLLDDGQRLGLAKDVAAGIAAGIPALLALLTSNDSEVQQAAAGALAYLFGESVDADAAVASAVVAAGGLNSIVSCVREGSTLSARLQSAVALTFICRSDPAARHVVAAAGGAAALMPLLHNTLNFAQEAGAVALSSIASDCPEGQQAVEAAGAVPALIGLLNGSEAAAVQSAAACVLIRLRCCHPAYLQQLAGSAPSLVRLLASGTLNQGSNAVSLLDQIWQQGGQRERQAVAAAGAAPALESYLAAHSQAASHAFFVGMAEELLQLLNNLPAE